MFYHGLVAARALRRIKFGETIYSWGWDDKEVFVKNYDIEAQEIAEILSGEFPGSATFFKVARRIHKEGGSKVLEKELSDTMSSLTVTNRFLKNPANLEHFEYHKAPLELIQLVLRNPHSGYLHQIAHHSNSVLTPQLLETIWTTLNEVLGMGAYEVVEHPNLAPSTLEKIARAAAEHDWYLEKVAFHPNNTGDTLEYLSQFKKSQSNVAQHPNTYPSTLRKLYLQSKAKKNQENFRELSGNKNTPKEILSEIIDLADKRYRNALLDNPVLDDEMALRLFHNLRIKAKREIQKSPNQESEYEMEVI